MLIVDLSNNNGPGVNFRALARDGVQGVYLKASQGSGFVDKYFAGWRKEAATWGLRVGAYHFAEVRAEGSWPAEADHFVRCVREVGPNDLRPALDLETTGGPKGAALENWARHWTRYVRKQFGVGPIFYSYPSFISDMRLSSPIGYGLWLASYGRNDGYRHHYGVPNPWRAVNLHQYTSNGRIGGMHGVDMSYAPKPRVLYAHPLKAALSEPVYRRRRHRA